MRRDRDSDEETEEEKIIEPLPPHRVRFTDMPWPLVDKAIRCKYYHRSSLECNMNDLSFSLT